MEAAATGPQAPAPLRRCSTKRKTGEAAASGSGRKPRPRAFGRKETTSAAASACADTEKANRLPAKDIRFILAQKPEEPPGRFRALKLSNPELVPRPGEEKDEYLMALYNVTRRMYEVQERLPKLQQWVRSELKEKGYVEVDDDWFKSIAKSNASLEREWPRIKAKIDKLALMDGPRRLSEGGDEESDSDEEDDEDTLEAVMKDYL